VINLNLPRAPGSVCLLMLNGGAPPRPVLWTPYGPKDLRSAIYGALGCASRELRDEAQRGILFRRQKR